MWHARTRASASQVGEFWNAGFAEGTFATFRSLTGCTGKPRVAPWEPYALNAMTSLRAAELDSFPVLERPPIVEVVCGFVYESLAPLDGMVLGVYWDERKDEYREHSLQPAFSDEPGFMLGNAPLRAVLVSKDAVRVLQIQHDRFFMNWRAAGEGYPRFSNRGGGGGLLEQALAEFGKLADFCKRRFDRVPVVTRIELAKIDVIERRSKHWSDLGDLASVMPITGTFASASHSGNREFILRFVEHETPKALVVAINSIADQAGGDIMGVRVEARAVRPLASGEQPEEAFIEANRSLNRAFFRLFSDEGLKRFGVKEGGR